MITHILRSYSSESKAPNQSAMAELCRDTQVTLDGFNSHRILIKRSVCIRSHRPVVRTLDFQSRNMSSILIGIISLKMSVEAVG